MPKLPQVRQSKPVPKHAVQTCRKAVTERLLKQNKDMFTAYKADYPGGQVAFESTQNRLRQKTLERDKFIVPF